MQPPDCPADDNNRTGQRGGRAFFIGRRGIRIGAIGQQQFDDLLLPRAVACIDEIEAAMCGIGDCLCLLRAAGRWASDGSAASKDSTAADIPEPGGEENVIGWKLVAAFIQLQPQGPVVAEQFLQEQIAALAGVCACASTKAFRRGQLLNP